MIRSASQVLVGTESGLVNSQVSRLRILVRAIAGLMGEEARLNPQDAIREWNLNSRIFGQGETDVMISQFLSTIELAVEELEHNPARAVSEGTLSRALGILERFPLMGSGLISVIRPAIGEHAISLMQGPDKTWIHQTLATINDEALLRKLVLMLEQASLPDYAQIRHGPLEYGKDVVIMFEKDGQKILRMYQAKCGDITTRLWTEAERQLEEMYLVPLDNLQIHGTIDGREGILISNGHAHPNVEPVMSGWFNEQASTLNRNFKFMHLDDIVNWIIDFRLIATFRRFVKETNPES